MNNLLQDLRYSARMFLKNPGFTAVAIITLALGIGANSTIFSFVNGVMLRPLPYRNPERLVLLDETAPKRGIDSMNVSFPNFADWRERNQVFEGIAAFIEGSYTLTGKGEPEQFPAARISHGLFEILGVAPVEGRTFRPEEDIRGQDMAVILSHGLWQRRFGSDPQVIGQTITLGDRPRTIIGVMPPGFRFPESADLWVPLALDSEVWTRTDHGLSAIARLKPGVTFEQAQAEMSAIALRIEEENPITNEGMSVNVIPLREALTGDYREALIMLLGAVAFVLLIGCANVTNLLLARASARQKEISIRAALGAKRSRIFRQVLTESLMLSVVGGVLGLILALWGQDLLLAAIPGEFPFWMKFDLDGRVVGFTTGISILTGLIFGTVPAMQTSKVDLSATLKEGGRSATAGIFRHRLRSILVVSEVGLSLVLLIGAGLMIGSFMELHKVNPGFNAEKVLTMSVALPQVRYSEPEKRTAFFEQLIERVRSFPGVEAAAAISNLPMRGGWGRSLTVEGFPVLSVGQAPIINHCVITPGYFRTMEIPLMMGRDFTDADARDALKVTIIDARLAHEYWPDESPLGKRIRFGPPEDNEPWHTIVGVVGAVRHSRLDMETRKSIYVPHLQIPVGRMMLAVRTSAEPGNLAAAVRNQVKEMDADQPVTGVMTMAEIVNESVWQPRLYSILFGFFAAFALILASIGIYSVMSYSVAARTHEIGIRMALGARSRDVLKLVISQGIKPVLIGVAIGLTASFALTRLMENLLFGVSATDPLTFVVITLLLITVAMLACWIPARRAARVDPMVALRYE